MTAGASRFCPYAIAVVFTNVKQLWIVRKFRNSQELCEISEPKRPVRLSSGQDGTDGSTWKGSRQTGILASIWMTARNGWAGPVGVSGGAIFRVTQIDGRALQVIGEDCRRRVRTADDG